MKIAFFPNYLPISKKPPFPISTFIFQIWKVAPTGIPACRTGREPASKINPD
jgi:hypothetical protein